MKLVRYGRPGAEKPGLIDENGALRDLARVMRDITPAVLSSAGLKKLRAVKTSRSPVRCSKRRSVRFRASSSARRCSTSLLAM